ncbi:uncharacterized protein B0T15DRAFT_545123 [Chaetomium strumarium]|uniref:Uncharacterized protein n=1 Tax=Chaetomium strumarium TaxID=1170767 RepID=A0AAJ0M532_9PEZI|nr:hypothetical protein B0T15DRAFT_545123 [Chaetomium strumarium]
MSSPTAIPMTYYDNYHTLDNPHLRNICRYDRDAQKHCIMCEKAANPTFLCSGCRSTTGSTTLVPAPRRPTFPPCPSPAARRILIFPAQSTTPVFARAEMTDGGKLQVAHNELQRRCGGAGTIVADDVPSPYESGLTEKGNGEQGAEKGRVLFSREMIEGLMKASNSEHK